MAAGDRSVKILLGFLEPRRYKRVQAPILKQELEPGMNLSKQSVVMTLLLVALSGSVYAKGVSTTSLKTAAEKAPVVVLATVQKHQYESLVEGKKVPINPHALWREYKITKVLKKPAGDSKTKLGKVLRICAKNNSCIRYKTQAMRSKDGVVLFEERADGVKQRSVKLETVNKMKGKTVVLFLQAQKNGYAHYGWFVSAQEWTKKVQAETMKHLKTSK